MIKPYDYYDFISESFLDYPDNNSLSIIFYMSGCDRNCEGCQNTNLKEYREYNNIDLLVNILEEKCKKEYTNKICLQGGDPLYKHNIILTKYLLDKLSKKYDICIYTGAEINEVKSYNLTGFKFIKCGIFDKNKYIGSKKTDTYIQFATSNQKLYDSNLNLLSKDGIYYF